MTNPRPTPAPALTALRAVEFLLAGRDSPLSISEIHDLRRFCQLRIAECQHPESPAPVENCPNRSRHVSAFAAGDREKCPYCQQVYVRKVGK